MRKNIPTGPGQYYWTEWKRVVDIGMSAPFNWRRPRHHEKFALCVLPFPGFPKPIKITKKIAGAFSGPIQN